jgi:stage III sporulation protein AD
MDIYLKAIGCALIALILSLILSKQSKDLSLLLSILVCTVIAVAAVNYLSPIVDLFQRLQSTANLDSTFMSILLRSVGIGLLAEITGLICSDAGNAALGKTLQLLAGAVILWMSVPLFSNIIELIEEILVSI